MSSNPPECTCGKTVCFIHNPSSESPQQGTPEPMPPGTKLHLCSLDYINGPRPTPEAMREIHDVAYHLRDHAKGQPPVEGCRFCAERKIIIEATANA